MESIYVHVCVCVFENANSMNIFSPKILCKCQVQPDIVLLQNLQNIAWTKRLVEKFCLQQLCRNAQLSVFMCSVIHKLYIFFFIKYVYTCKAHNSNAVFLIKWTVNFFQRGFVSVELLLFMYHCTCAFYKILNNDKTI